MRSPGVIDGFWLPQTVKDRVLSSCAGWESLTFAAGRECGRECDADAPGAVAVRWPVLDASAWTLLVEGLSAARVSAPRGREFWDRLQAAIVSAARRLSDPADPLHRASLEALPRYTGYSAAMVAATLGAPEMWDVGLMARALALTPRKSAVTRWEPMPGLPGRMRFFPGGGDDLRGPGLNGLLPQLAGRIPYISARPLFTAPEPPQFITGYGAGNVPGTALIIALLALATTLAGGAPPVVVVRNSRREPIFSPLVFAALEKADPELIGTVAILTWDYEDSELQDRLLSRSDLIIAAAGDETIERIAAQIAAAGKLVAEREPAAMHAPAAVLGPPAAHGAGAPRAPRFHAHGHKVSFTAIGKEMLSERNQSAPSMPDGRLVDMVAALAGLDSIFWDQKGCLSSRIHFVERGAPGDLSVLDYAERLTGQLRRLSLTLPRGAWPLRPLHDAFDRYKALEGIGRSDGGLRVLSDYEDEFVVVIDERPLQRSRLDPGALGALVNDCQGRVVVVRALENLMDLPRRYLRLLPSRSLQSLSVAVGMPGEGLSEGFLDFATACGARGVTAIRIVGRGAFPQLAYSWDGFLPLDLLCRRALGHFTTIEFDEPFDALVETYRSSGDRTAGPGLPHKPPSADQ